MTTMTTEKLTASCWTHKEYYGRFYVQVVIYAETDAPNARGSYQTRLGTVTQDGFTSRTQANRAARAWRAALKCDHKLRRVMGTPSFIPAS